MNFTESKLTSAIQKAAKEWVYDYNEPICFIDINYGSCGEFASFVINKLPSNHEVTIVSSKDFFKAISFENFRFIPNESSNDISKDILEMEFTNHVWLYFNRLHFDIEKPYGVNNFLDLPYFKREVEGHIFGLSEYEVIKAMVDRGELNFLKINSNK
jgi:hypothetical protein